MQVIILIFFITKNVQDKKSKAKREKKEETKKE